MFIAPQYAQSIVDEMKASIHRDINIMDQDGIILDAMLEAPWPMRSPIVRNGNKVTVGYCPQVWEQWIAADK